MLETHIEVMCPNCGESILLFFDLSLESQSYIEDCAVCCRPMQVSYEVDAGEVQNLSVDATD
ncbi:MAG: CPXCG motif-containing cysteine-rich protein [Steroidobacteraceae bacterium]